MGKYKVSAVLALMIALIAPLVYGQDAEIALVGPPVAQLQEGRVYDIIWRSEGVDFVSITAEGTLTSLPDTPRGPFVIKIADGVPGYTGMFSWQVPFIDAASFVIHITGYNSDGEVLGDDSRGYAFRPDIFAKRKADGIYVDLRNPDRQRLYVLRKTSLLKAYLTSGARTHVALPKNQDSPDPHDHIGVFRVNYKDPMYWSNEYDVWMTNAMRIWKGHFIHGTYPSEYQWLGHPASSGCIRLHRTDAKELYDMTPLGTRVEVLE